MHRSLEELRLCHSHNQVVYRDIRQERVRGEWLDYLGEDLWSLKQAWAIRHLPHHFIPRKLAPLRRCQAGYIVTIFIIKSTQHLVATPMELIIENTYDEDSLVFSTSDADELQGYPTAIQACM